MTDPKPDPKPEKKKSKIFVPVGLVVALAAGYFAYRHLKFVSTDDAQVGAHVSLLSSRVNGTVEQVFVEENQKVKAGQTLAQIDTSDFSNAFDAARANVASLAARVAESKANFQRAADLIRSHAITHERFDDALATYKETEARFNAARAQSQQAELNVHYTKIVAPSDGLIGRKSIEPGQFVPAGQALFGFVAGSERWVTANLKETELPDVRVGQKAEISVDALPSHSLKGEVESIGPSTGAVFSLLPPDNATGNFTKVVQRVPVRIKLVELGADDVERLQAGLSAEVDISVR
jgi:membrane fusion protein (multidrug efflux system)